MEQHPLKVRAMYAPWYNGVEFMIKKGNATADNIVMSDKDDEAFKGICDQCGKEGLVIEAIDPWYWEGILVEQPDEPEEETWCEDCWNERLDSI